MKLGRRHNYHKGRAAIRHYANLRKSSDNLRFSCSGGAGCWQSGGGWAECWGHDR